MNTQPAITTAIWTPDGIESTPYQAASLNDASGYEPSGVYTVARTYNRVYALELDAHLARLEESARLMDIAIPWARAALRAALRQVIEQAGYAEARFRITVPQESPERVYFAVEPLQAVPAALREHGVHTQTFPTRRDNPKAKDNRWIASRADLNAQMGTDTYEGLLTDTGGHILEGFTSNFYAIMAGTLYTAAEGMLHGISRRIVLEVAPDVLPVNAAPVTVADLPNLEEAFLTSSSRGVIPIVMIDGQPIGSGSPGPHTQTIAARYDAWAAAHIMPI